jgi:DNA-binding NtrC family response regulator
MILIVDDDPSVTTSLGLLLKQHGLRSSAADGPEQALQKLRSERYELVLQDMNFSLDTSGREGLELLRRIRAEHPVLPVILITAWGSIALAVEGVKSGASDFLTKPWTNTHLIQSVETVLSLAGAGGTETVRDAPRRSELDTRWDFASLVGEAPEFVRVLELIGRVAPTDASVLITGESGTGKELVAEAIHRNSRRRDGQFVKVNLGGISSTLFESEMFGHVRGAFTDARADRKGRFEIADGGTIFLDEVGELDPSSQVKLLRVLQDRTYEVLGSSTTRAVDVRVVSATNRDPAQEVEAGNFREDLFYRLNLISVRVPALRERRSDVSVLARHFLDRCSTTYGRTRLELAPDALSWLEEQDWPGNVRQLAQTLERAVLVVQGERLDAQDLIALSELEVGGRRGDELPRPGSMTLDQMERAMISNCMRHYCGNLTRVAEALGLSRAALYRRLEKYGLERG